MAEADLEGPIIPHGPISTRGRPLWRQGMACIAILPLLGFIGSSGQSLWHEYRLLRNDQVSVRASQIVGYVDINPSPSFAESPPDWFHDEGDVTRLWAGWRKGKHHWFNLGLGDIDRNRLSTPMGQDVVRSIDVPLFEGGGGERWVRVTDDARVAGFDPGESGTAIAFPLTILDKVETVNNLSGDRPILVAYTPVSDSTSAFEAVLDGKRLTLGHAGYFFGHHPILYDRGTESLWTEQDDAMVAIAGPKKGAILKRIAKLEIVAWSAWKADHPEGKLLIGADRSQPRPVD